MKPGLQHLGDRGESNGDELLPSRIPKLTCSPANVEASQLFKDNIKEYERRVKVCVHFVSSCCVTASTDNLGHRGAVLGG
jgi:hypothetical protein